MQKFEIGDFSKAREVTFCKPSPDGSRILYGVSGTNLEENRKEGWLYVYNPETGTSRQLTFEGDAGAGIWTDDRTVLFPGMRGAAARYAEKHKDEKFTAFYALSVDGGEASERFRVPVAGASAICVDGDRFVITGEQDEAEKIGEDEQVTVYDEFPYHRNDVPFGMTNKKRTRLWLYTVSTGEFKPLTAPLFHMQQRMSVGFEPFLSEDKSRLYFVGEEYTSRMSRTQDAWAADLASGEVRLLFRNDRYMMMSGFEHAGRVYFFAMGLTKEICAGDLISVAPQGGEYRVDFKPDGMLYHAVPDDDRIICVVGEHKDTVLYSLREGEAVKETVPEYHVDTPPVKAAGRWFYCGAGVTGMRQLVEWKDGKTAAVTQVGREFTESYPFPLCEPVDAVRIRRRESRARLCDQAPQLGGGEKLSRNPLHPRRTPGRL